MNNPQYVDTVTLFLSHDERLKINVGPVGENAKVLGIAVFPEILTVKIYQESRLAKDELTYVGFPFKTNKAKLKEHESRN